VRPAVGCATNTSAATLLLLGGSWGNHLHLLMCSHAYQCNKPAAEYLIAQAAAGHTWAPQLCVAQTQQHTAEQFAFVLQSAAATSTSAANFVAMGSWGKQLLLLMRSHDSLSPR
jgi:hypothetical protein